MRTCICVFFILALQSSYSQWQTYYPANRNITLLNVCVVNQNLIWATGSYGTIVKTTNGGLSWNTYRLIDTALHCFEISAINEQIAWIEADNGRRLFKTTNGGISWNQQYFTIDGICAVEFFNSNTGFLIDHIYRPYADTSRMMITRNGGITWYKNIYSPLTTVLINKSLGIVDSNFIWLIDDNKFYTLTGGLNNQWQMHIVDTTNPYLMGSSFVNSLTGFVCDGLNPTAFKIFKTTNSGVNWFFYSSDSVIGIYTMCFIPNTNMAFVNGSSKIRISRDNGLTWIHRVNYNYSVDSIDMWYMDAYDTNSVWIAVNNGRLFKYNINYIGIEPVGINISVQFKLYQNYPNPFNPTTKIRFALPIASDFSIKVYDISGREVYAVYDSKQAGEYEFTFDGAAIASGIYFYQLKAGDYIDTKKMILLK